MKDAVHQALLEARGGRETVAAVHGIADDSPLYSRLWGNPCWFSFRLNYLALQFNNPVYGYIQERLNLLRPDFVILWALYLGGDATLTDVARSSGFPKNTLSRAAGKLHRLGMIRREADAADQRRINLYLSSAGRAAVDGVKDTMLAQERLMLDCLSPAERLTLSEILTKMVAASEQWPSSISDALAAARIDPDQSITTSTGRKPALQSNSKGSK